MLITPRPGADRNSIASALREARFSAENLRSAQGNAYERLLKYLEWVTVATRQLQSHISSTDVNELVLTSRYHALLSRSLTVPGASQERLVNGLLDLELSERAEAFEEAETDLRARIDRWKGQEWFVVADSSFYIHNPVRLEDVDLHQVLGLPTGEHIRLLFPIAIVDELDGVKEASKQRARYRASHTLGVLDRVLNGSTFGILRRAKLVPESSEVHGEINMEILLDPPGHVRLPIADDEIIDRAVAIQALAAREVRLLTCDTGQNTRGRMAGLQVTKVAAKDPGPEPDWAALEKPGTGARAMRRERRNDQAASPRDAQGTA